MSATSIDVFEELHDLLHLFRDHLKSTSQLVASEMSLGEVRILVRVGRFPGLTQKDLVAHSHTDKAQMARALNQLEDKGWLVRTASASDKRVRCLHLSTQGKALVARLRSQRAALAAQLLHAMPQPAQQQLMDLLVQARASVQSQSGDGNATSCKASRS